ncbi:cobaltochelatase CobN subunit [Advenella incenata]|uniref:Cobaltochelatase CobN subunit n=1 Tax=Advenella incenata TaxID=267800 RepID=A0A4Q7VTY5_9BURK|nr:cobaltochelatase subunit CobN [Advenella incenata]RZT99854.1 cobaltochelatase CobN subunit [Advenella incenata]
MRLSRLIWRICYYLLIGVAGMAPVYVSAAPVVQVLHNGFVSAEKFRHLQTVAERQAMGLRHLNVETASPQAISAAVAAGVLTVLDVPRPGDRSMVEQRLEQALQQQKIRGAIRLTVGGGRPAWHGLEAPVGGLLAELYAAGGEANYGRFFALARSIHEGVAPSPDLLAPPEKLPAAGFYHPQASRVFDNVQSYLNWHASAASPSRPDSIGRVAFLISRHIVTDFVTGEVDELIRRSETAGLLPIVFWADADDPEGLQGALKSAAVDVLVNLTHMRGGAQRTRDFKALNVPVIQTLSFREGEARDWPAAPSGVNARTAAVFLAGPEGWGVSDPLVLSAVTAGVDELLPQQAQALIGKLRSLVALRHTRAADKRLALMFWNYPAGEKNLGASNLNLPRSIVSIQGALAGQGYDVGEPVSEKEVIDKGQRMLGALYGSVSLDDLLAEDLAALYPLSAYESWLAGLPDERQRQLRRHGSPDGHRAIRKINGQLHFVIPRWKIGHLLVMPQMPRHADAAKHYHDTASVPDHLYMAAYLYLQQQYAAHALIHLGTHGSQEWLPGKDRGLAASDYSWLAVGSMPVFYPYIQDNVGEAIQAKRRGRAVIISHQTPPFAPAGLYDQLRDLHHLIHEYQQLDEGIVRKQVSLRIREAAFAANLHRDLGWSDLQAERDFPGFLQVVHNQLHELARTATPLGLHTFGQPASDEHRAGTIVQQLGEPFYAALGIDREELFVDDHKQLKNNPAYLALHELLKPTIKSALPGRIAGFADRARANDLRLRDTQENEALLAGLAGGFVAPGAGGDPIRNPDVMSGRNLYAFEADKIPTRAAYDSAAMAYEQLVQAFRSEHDGQWPRKLAFSLWSSEAIRHLGMTEAQILHALGLRPVWDAGGRITALEIIPTTELGRPRTDVVIQVTGVYRDQFDSFMRLLDDALVRLAALEEPDNPIVANNLRIATLLRQQGMPSDQAAAAARYRIFGNAPGQYGTGVPDLALRSTEWNDDGELAQHFLASSRHVYGRGQWGARLSKTNLLAEQLRGTQAAIMSRSSNLHGVLSTDHPFEFLGGLSAAVRHLDGQAPQMLISDLRDGRVSTTGLARFLANELRARYLNPQWIDSMQQEGYAGTLQVLNVTNNLFGWQVMDPTSVRDDQWQAMFDTYVNDTRELGTREWFEQHNPTAQAQILERMAEAMRKGYWNASEQTRRDLVQRWQQLAEQFDVHTGAEATRRYIADIAKGFGLASGAAPDTDAGSAHAQTADTQGSTEQELQAVHGQILERVEVSAEPSPETPLALLLLLFVAVTGGVRQWWVDRQLTQRTDLT